MDSLKNSLRKAIERNLSNKPSQQDDKLDNIDDPDLLFEREFKKVNLSLKD